jgi:hypothetical protein
MVEKLDIVASGMPFPILPKVVSYISTGAHIFTYSPSEVIASLERHKMAIVGSLIHLIIPLMRFSASFPCTFFKTIPQFHTRAYLAAVFDWR